mgnify:CR=1 FL=1
MRVFVFVETYEIFTYICAGWQLSNNLFPHMLERQPLPPSVKKDTVDNLLLIDWKIKDCQRTKQHICKSHKPTHDQNLQKSCFLADAPKPTHHPKDNI